MLAILFFAYTTFRFICEIKEVRIGFIEFILGNKPNSKKVKKSKEIFNGSLEDKPIYLKETQETEVVDAAEATKEEILSTDSENNYEEIEQKESESDFEE